MNDYITRNNPIAEAFDETIASLKTDETRPLEGFHEFVKHSAELQRFQLAQYVFLVEDGSIRLSEKLYGIVTAAARYGFETGKSYVIGGQIDKMLRLEDEVAGRVPLSPPEPTQRWIPVTERLPEKMGTVAVLTTATASPVTVPFVAAFDPRITHWCQLPELPEVSE